METKNETTVITEAAAVIAPKAWWDGKFVLSISDSTTEGKKTKAATIYRIIAVEAGRAVGQFVIADGTVALTVFPLRFIPIEQLTGSIDRNKNALRVFDGYGAAVDFARLSRASLHDDQYSDEQRANIVAISRGEAPAKAAKNDNKAASRRRRNA